MTEEHPDQVAREPVDPAVYRLAMGRFASGVAVVTARLRGHDVALTVDSLTSVSLDPVLLLVSLHPEARVLEGLQEGSDLGVSVLTSTQRGVAEWLGETGRPLHEQLGRVAHHRGPATGRRWWTRRWRPSSAGPWTSGRRGTTTWCWPRCWPWRRARPTSTPSCTTVDGWVSCGDRVVGGTTVTGTAPQGRSADG